MKTSKIQKNTTLNSHSSKPFFSKSGKGSFFSPSQEVEKPFFSPLTNNSNKNYLQRSPGDYSDEEVSYPEEQMSYADEEVNYPEKEEMSYPEEQMSYADEEVNYPEERMSYAEEKMNESSVIEHNALGGVGVNLSYQAFLRDMYNKVDEALLREAEYMSSKGVPEKKIARWSNKARNEAKKKIRAYDPLKKVWEQRNLKEWYKNRVGPSYEQLKRGSAVKERSPKTDKQIIESAAKTNSEVNKLAVGFKIAGRIIIAVDIGFSGYKIISAPPSERPKVFIKEASKLGGAAAGGYAGAKGGAALCSSGGPWGAGICGTIGGVGGAFTGAWAGGKAGEWLVDELYPIRATGFPEQLIASGSASGSSSSSGRRNKRIPKRNSTKPFPKSGSSSGYGL